MQKLVSLVVMLMGFSASPSMAASYVSYNCQLLQGGTPRHGVEFVNLSFTSVDSTSRVVVTLFKTNADGSLEMLGGAPAVYAHSANIHSGRYAGFKKFTPSERSEPTPFHSEKIKAFALKENAERNSAPLAFPESKNAVYSCQ